jgi:hypothetical protein
MMKKKNEFQESCHEEALPHEHFMPDFLFSEEKVWDYLPPAIQLNVAEGAH